MDSVITNTGVSEKYTMKQELTELNKSIGTVHELFKRKVKTANAIMSCCFRIDSKEPTKIGVRRKVYTILDATQVIRTDEHAEGCRVEDAHAFYHQLQLNELKRLAQVIRGRYRKFMMSWQAVHPPA
ncbi:hypothetical protein T08_10492 [Trichinella sp. T8]|nr:hypothetical protein T08_10492 [Trichinella sp. T8]